MKVIIPAMSLSPPTPRWSWLFLVALVVGFAYWLGGQAVVDHAIVIAFKGAGVGLLTIWAAINARGRDGWLIVLVLGFGTLGDVLIEAVGLVPGAQAFLAGHVVAIVLYLLNRRRKLSASQAALGLALLVGVPLIAWLLPADRSAAPGVALYAVGLGAMAATAWTSRFPRYQVGIGAVMFVLSDLLIFARMGPLAHSVLPGSLIWPLYFGGQLLIAGGLVTTIVRRRADEELHHRL